MKPVTKTIAVLGVFGILTGAAWAQFSKPEDAIKYRQSVMIVIGQHFGRLGAMVKGNQPFDQKSFANNTAVIEALAGLTWEAFLVPGSDQGKTTMNSSVLKDPDGLKSLSQQFQLEVGKLSAAAKGNDFNAIKAQFGAVAQSCKSCHGKTRK
ncbi:MAG: cytochrome c [Desulfobacteraceae bacterium]|jgi:cytochrome c556|nr:cytochrome c [Desulfobacteraceae bacterium]